MILFTKDLGRDKQNFSAENLSKMVYIIHNFLVLHFGDNLMKNRSKIPKLQMQMHEKLHKNVNENMFACTFLCNIFHVFLWLAIKAALCC